MRLLKNTISVFIILSFFAFNSIYSQVKYTTSKWKSPTFVIEVAGSFDLPLGDARGPVGDFFQFTDYGTKLGWGAQFNFKFGLGQKGDLRPFLTLGYAQIQGSDNSTAFIGTNWISTTTGYPLPGNQLPVPTTGTSKIIFRMPFVGAGFEYAFVEADKFKRRFIPFIGVDLNVSVITGIYRQTPTVVIGPIAPNVETAFTIKPDVRMGFGVGAGADVRFIPNFGMTFGIKYRMVNLMGQSSDFLKEENKMNLLDHSAPNLNSYLSKNRYISYMEFYLGGAIYLGKSKK
jgi:opacity protein-like surface antigen